MEDEQIRLIYERINKNATPVKQESLLLEFPEYCEAVWYLGEWIPTEHTNQLYEKLKVLESKGIVYKTSDSKEIKGILHFTLFQTRTFPIDPYKVFPFTNQTKRTIESILQITPEFTVKFEGISKTRFGLFLCGYPTINLNNLRDEIRKNVKGIIEPHPQDIYHSTLFRFTEDPDEKDIEFLNNLVKEFEGKELYRFIPRSWEFGFGTWRQLEEERIVLFEIKV
jgi:hypothetical protein